MILALFGLVLWIVISAMSTHGMVLLACKNNYTAIQTYLYNIINSMTLGIFGLVQFASLRKLKFQTVGDA